MVKRTALLALALGSPLLLGALLVGGPVAEWVFVLVSLVFPVALIALAEPPRRARPVLAGLLLLLEGSAVALLLLAAPQSTALMLLGLGLGPLALVGLGYALSFDA